MAKRASARGRPAPSKEPVTTAAPAPQTRETSTFALVVTGLFLALSAFGMAHHEMWRDEYQAWMVAREAHSLPQLLQNMRYEGNPALWHLFLFAILVFTRNPAWMQALHVAFSTGFVFLFARYAPFPRLWRVLFALGYYSLFEYNLISRSYGMGLLLALTFCVLYEHRRRHMVLLGVVLALLANAHVFGLVIALCFGATLIVDAWARKREGEAVDLRALGLCLLILVAGAALSAWQIYPKPGNSFPVAYAEGVARANRFRYAVYRIVVSYFALPRTYDLHFWNMNVFEKLYPQPDGTYIPENMSPIWGLSIFVVFVFALLRRPIALVPYLLGTIAFVSFFYLTLLTYTRYVGHLFVVLICSLWIAEYYRDQTYADPSLEKGATLARPVARWLTTILLLVSALGGVSAYVADLSLPFSTSGEVGRRLRELHLETNPIVAYPDFIVSPLAGVLDRNIYYAHRKEEGSFIIWDQKRNPDLTDAGAFDQVPAVYEKTRKDVVAIFAGQPMIVDPVTKANVPLEHAMLTPALSVDLLFQVPAGIVEDERYFVYLVKPAPVNTTP